MAHLHSIYDNDAHFCIDPVTRRIKEDTSLKTLLAQGDHNSERFTFELPRIIEGHDMSLCDKVEIHYLNGANPGVYEVDDLQISPNSDDVVIFSWLISNNATQLAATLAFAIKLACTSDGVVDYAYNTLPYEKVNVGKSINNGEVIIQEYADILAQWKQELSDAATNVKVDATLTVSGKPADAAVVGKKFSSLSEEIADIPSGKDGKSAYKYAQEGGFTGTESEFSEKLAQELPTALKNPNALTFSGSVSATYDGSAPVTVNIPGGTGTAGVEVDATLTQSGQAADAAAVGERLSSLSEENAELKEDLSDFTLEIEGKNINSSDNEIGYIDDDGTLRNYADYWRSKDFISVKQNGNICAFQISYMNNVIRVCQYDKNKLFIKYSDLYTTGHHDSGVVTNIILSDDIAYIKLAANGINETNTLDKSKTAIYYFDGVNYPLEYIEYVPPKKVVDVKKVYDNGEAIKIPTKVSELENDANFISANGEITLKATVIFDFDEGAQYDDRAKILEENGLVGTFHFDINYTDENIVNNSIPLYMKGGHDVSLYGGVGTQPSLYIGENAENTWYEYIKAGVEWFEKHGIFLGTMYACHVNKSSIGILKACKKLGFKYVRGSYCVVNGESWDTDKDCIYYNTGTNSPYKMPVCGHDMDKSFEEIKSDIDDAVAKSQTICLFTHTLAEATEGISMSKTIFRQVVEYVKSLKDAGSVDVLNAREYYDKYNQIDGEKRKYNRVMAGITNLYKVK